MNRHTSMFRLLYLLCLGLLLQSCITDDEDPTASITAAKTSVPVSAAAGEEEITIEASGTEWTVTEEIDWLEAAKVDNSTLRVSYEENPDTEERSGTVTAAISDQSVNITVTQEADKRPAFASDAAIAAQTYMENVTDVMLTLPEATGGDGTLTYGLMPDLPDGLDFDAGTREITGTPEAVLTATEYTYTATDEDGDTDELTFMITINEMLMPAFPNDAVIADQIYTENVKIADLTLPQATGGDGTLTYSLSPNPPQGLTFDATQRILTGTPQSNLPQTTYTYTATDEAGSTAALTFTLIVGTAPAFASGAAIADQTYIQNEPIADLTLPTATGGDGALTYSLSPALPRGLTFDATQRTITGTPEVMQTATEYTYTVTDEDGDDAALTFMLTVEEDLMLAFANDASVPSQLYTETKAIADLTLPQATGGNGDLTYTLAKSDGTKLPDGLTFDAMMRVLAGRPTAGTAAGATEYILTATDRDGDAAALTFMITIVANEVPAFANDASVVPQLYTETKAIADLTLPRATGGNGDLTYSLTKSDGTVLPNGLTLDRTMRVLAGRPTTGTAAGATEYTLTATDRDGDTDELTFSITIRAASATPITLSAATLTVEDTEGSNNTIMLTSSVMWEATEVLEWITVNPLTGTGTGTAQAITLDYSINAGSERMGTVTFTETTAGASPKFSVTLTVTQPMRLAPIVVNETEISVGPAATEAVITFTSSVGWEASRPAGTTWVTGVSPASGLASATAQTVTVNFDANTGSTMDRAVMITLTEASAPNFAVMLTVTQRGRVADGMIPINNLEQLHAMRYDLTGDGQPDHNGDQSSTTDRDEAYAAAFPDVVYAANRYSGYVLMRDLNFKDDDSYSDASANKVAFGGTESGNGWLPVGPGTRTSAFSGTFNGGGHKISNLYINRTTAALRRLGLFGVATGTIRNTGLENAKVTGGENTLIGGLVGRAQGSPTISGCYASGGTIEGGANVRVGGLVGYQAGGTIRGCYVSGATIEGGTNVRVGGLLGLQLGTISGCYVSGGTNMAGRGGHVGGLVGGQIRGTMRACYVNNSVSSASNGATSVMLGSLVGSQNGTVTACYAGGRNYTKLRGTGSGTVTNSYYQAAAEPNDGDDAKPTVQAKTKAALITPMAYGSTGIFKDWNLNIDGEAGADDPWDFGNNMEYPILKGVGGTQR